MTVFHTEGIQLWLEVECKHMWSQDTVNASLTERLFTSLPPSADCDNILQRDFITFLRCL